jgi:hypothetical protein
MFSETIEFQSDSHARWSRGQSHIAHIASKFVRAQSDQ